LLCGYGAPLALCGHCVGGTLSQRVQLIQRNA
jgi:surfactin synthase thioesterase subunit